MFMYVITPGVGCYNRDISRVPNVVLCLVVRWQAQPCQCSRARFIVPAPPSSQALLHFKKDDSFSCFLVSHDGNGRLNVRHEVNETAERLRSLCSKVEIN